MRLRQGRGIGNSADIKLKINSRRSHLILVPFTYEVSADGTQRRSLSIRSSSVSPPLYRSKEKKRIVTALLANSSLLVVSEPGAGKSFLAEAVKEELEAQSFLVAAPQIGTV